MCWRTWKLCLQAACIVGLLPTLVEAQQPGSPGAPTREQLEWKPHWHRANLWDGAVIVGGWSLYLAERTVLPRRSEAIWEGPILFDEPIRDVLRAHVRGDRETAETISDVMLTGSLVHNWLFAHLVVALALHQEPEVAWQMSVANAEAYAISFSLVSLLKTVSGRERPYVDECERDPEYSEKCGEGRGIRAFPSGHAAATATGAGLLCAHHTHLPLYDGGILDYGACGVGIAMTLLTATMRITADRHWATDVLFGHALGFSSGYLVPTLLYYTDPDPDPDDVALLPMVSPDRLALQIRGRF